MKSIFHTSSLRTLYFSSEMHFFTLGPLIIQKWHFRKKVVVTTSTSSKKVWNYKRYLFYGTLNTLSFGKMVKNWKTYFILHQICQSMFFIMKCCKKFLIPLENFSGEFAVTLLVIIFSEKPWSTNTKCFQQKNLKKIRLFLWMNLIFHTFINARKLFIPPFLHFNYKWLVHFC